MRRAHAAILGAAIIVVVPLTTTATATATPPPAGTAPAGTVVTTTHNLTKPNGPLPASTATAAEQAKIAERHQLRREQIAAAEAGRMNLGAPEANARPGQLSPPTTTGGLSTQSLLIARNNRNTIASGSSGSTLAEPAAANRGDSVFYTGNTYASYSNDRGVTWTNVALPAGPTNAPTPCCDQDVVRAHNVDRIFSIMLYLNSAATHGVVRIFVRQTPSSAPMCTYDIAPATNNTVPDYPHIGVSQNALYLGLNNVGSSWLNSQVIRFNLQQMAACQSVNTNTLTWTGSVGQRLLMPVEGAQNATTMYFAAIENTNSIRVFSWPESSTSISHWVRSITNSSFTNPDCRGGTGNYDFIERATAWTAAGFRMRGTLHGSRVTWFWHSAPTGGIPQAHVRTASFNTSDMTLVAQNQIWNADFCFGYPVVSGNIFGDLGLSIAAGGRAGGGGTAAEGYVAVDDTPADPIHFGSVSLTASGTHNLPDGRYGDYFTIRPNARCQNAWVATNYSLLNGTATANVNARYIEFGSTLDAGCF